MSIPSYSLGLSFLIWSRSILWQILPDLYRRVYTPRALGQWVFIALDLFIQQWGGHARTLFSDYKIRQTPTFFVTEWNRTEYLNKVCYSCLPNDIALLWNLDATELHLSNFFQDLWKIQNNFNNSQLEWIHSWM